MPDFEDRFIPLFDRYDLFGNPVYVQRAVYLSNEGYQSAIQLHSTLLDEPQLEMFRGYYDETLNEQFQIPATLITISTELSSDLDEIQRVLSASETWILQDFTRDIDNFDGLSALMVSNTHRTTIDLQTVTFYYVGVINILVF